MAQLSFVCGASTLDLLNWTDDFNLEYYDGYTRAIHPLGGYASVIDTLNLSVRGDAADSLATVIQKVDQKMRECRRYWEGEYDANGVWLKTNVTGESAGYQAIVYGMSGNLGESILSPYTDDHHVMRKYTLAVQRAALWEALARRSFYTGGSISSLGGMWNYGLVGAIVGDEPARVSLLSFDSAGGTLAEFWAGFRSDSMGTIANFQPVWDLGLVTADRDAGDTTRVTGAGADVYGAQYSHTAFADPTMKWRVALHVSDVTANVFDQRGKFNVLLRAKVDNVDTQCFARLSDGLDGGTNWRTQSRVRIDGTGTIGTGWYLYPLGTVSIPGIRGRSTNDTSCMLRVEASREVGTGHLWTDCLILIPYNEGAVHVCGANVTAANNLNIIQQPDGHVEAQQMLGAAGGLPVNNLAPGVQNYGLPVGAGNLILACQQSTVSVLADAADAMMYAYTRWRTMRGAEV